MPDLDNGYLLLELKMHSSTLFNLNNLTAIVGPYHTFVTKEDNDKFEAWGV